MLLTDGRKQTRLMVLEKYEYFRASLFDRYMYIVSLVMPLFVSVHMKGQIFSRRRNYVTSHDFNVWVHGISIEIVCDSGKRLIFVNTGQICMKFEADTPQK